MSLCRSIVFYRLGLFFPYDYRVSLFSCLVAPRFSSVPSLSSVNSTNNVKTTRRKTGAPQVISMTARLLDGGDAGVCGVLTSGGTESIVLAAKAHRDFYREVTFRSNSNVRFGDVYYPDVLWVDCGLVGEQTNLFSSSPEQAGVFVFCHARLSPCLNPDDSRKERNVLPCRMSLSYCGALV